MKNKIFTFNLIKRDTQTIIKEYRKPLIMISILMGFLVFFLNVFLAIALYGNKFNDSMKEKLGVYIYLKDSAEQSQEKIINLKSDLEAKGLRVQYSSKQEALGFVEKRVSDLTQLLRKYQLENPLPATFYVMYNNQSQFDLMKEQLEANKDLILNLWDISDNAIKTQEKRVLTVINLSNFVQSFSYTVVLTMILTIITFAIFFLKTIFSHFIGDIQAKKLLGATANQIIRPFVNVIFIALGLAFILALLLAVATVIPLDNYITALFSKSFLAALLKLWGDIFAIVLIEVLVLMGLLMGVSYHFVSRLHKKLK